MTWHGFGGIQGWMNVNRGVPRTQADNAELAPVKCSRRLRQGYCSVVTVHSRLGEEPAGVARTPFPTVECEQLRSVMLE